MSSGPNNRFWNRTGFRLSAGYLTLFVVSLSLIFAAIYLILVRSLETHDRDLIEESFSHYILVYDTSGLDGLKREMAKSGSVAELNQLLLRIQDQTTHDVLFYQAPKDIAEYDEALINQKLLATPVGKGAIVAIESKQDSEDVLEVMQGRTANGNIIQVGKNSEDREDFLDEFRKSFLLVTIPCLFIGVLGAFLLSSRVLRPVRQLIAAIRKIEKGEVDVQAIEGSGQDELSELSRLFNRVWAKNQRLVRGMRQSLDMVAHDLRTPMTRVRGYAEEALRHQDIALKNQAISESIVNLDETTGLLNLMMNISETESGAVQLHKEPMSCYDLLYSVKDLYAMVAEDKKMRVVIQAETELKIVADKRIKQAFANLLDNALKYSKPGSEIVMTATLRDEVIIFDVRDQGPGIPEASREKIWQRYDRGDVQNWQPGLGLGLSLVASIVHAHDGSVEIADTQSSGTTFRITLPAETESRLWADQLRIGRRDRQI